MAFEHKPGTFSLFKNDKGDNDKRPDYRGEGKDMAGRDIEVAAWLREGGKGKFLSCTFKLKEKTKGADKPSQRDVADVESEKPF
jgi:hypothetical protein